MAPDYHIRLLPSGQSSPVYMLLVYRNNYKSSTFNIQRSAFNSRMRRSSTWEVQPWLGEINNRPINVDVHTPSGCCHGLPSHPESRCSPAWAWVVKAAGHCQAFSGFHGDTCANEWGFAAMHINTVEQKASVITCEKNPIMPREYRIRLRNNRQIHRLPRSARNGCPSA